jgi:putative membrane protein
MNPEQNNKLPQNDKLVFRWIIAVSVVVFAAVVILNRQVLPKPEVIPSWTYFLPKLNAFINGTCSILLLVSLYFIRQGNIQTHKRINLTAFALSSIFLLSYITYHWLATETTYGDASHDGVLDELEKSAVASSRMVYYVILVSHIILAALVLPLVLMSFYRGLKMDVVKHRKLVRWTFPIWLYVTVTGVVVYLMISPYYPL